MNIRRKMLFFGWITLLIFPIPAFLVKHYFEGVNFFEFIQFNQLKMAKK
jgi:hypothetical protein